MYNCILQFAQLNVKIKTSRKKFSQHIYLHVFIYSFFYMYFFGTLEIIVGICTLFVCFITIIITIIVHNLRLKLNTK